MDWHEKYADKIVSAEEALMHIKPGENVVPADFCAEPDYLMTKLAEVAPKLGGKIKTTHGGNVGAEHHLDEGMEKYIDMNILCCVPKSRQVLDEHRGMYTPCYFHQWPRLLGKGGPQQADVALVSLSEPDENGMCSMSVSADYTHYLPDIARLTIGMVNKEVPWIESNLVSIDKIDYLVEHDEPVVKLLDSVPGEKEEKIAKNVLPLIHDGDCIQIGRGKLPDYVMSQLMDRKHLGIHSEMISDGVMKLMKAGVVDNSMKQVHPGKTVCCMVAGSAELYDWVDHNPDIDLLPVDFTNDPFIIAQNDNVVSLNSALEVDLLGQVCCEMIGPRQFTGIGGFTDFVRGAQESKGGRVIIALSATNSKGTISRIVPTITPGAATAATRWDADYIVTEYGVAHLWGRSNQERAEAIISIAHPDYRDNLRKVAIERGLIRE
ncbi:MAG: acetyl-CoA hydrolase/transferase family protein [Eggerthellaceae bacterium]|jgi:4-hydroxybutyrate CoA-transferase